MVAGVRVMAIGIALGAASVSAVARSQAGPHQFTVTMSNMNYGTIPTTAKVGDTIIWVNRDTVPHTVTARDKSFDLRVAPGQKAQLKLQKAGTFAIYCIYHVMMRATLKVAS